MSKKTIKTKLTESVLPSKWFWVCALYKSERGSKKEAQRKRHLWERRVFLIRAVRGEERRMAREAAKAHEHKYKNARGETVYWRLKSIESYAELFDKRVSNGTEVFWEFFERVDR